MVDVLLQDTLTGVYTVLKKLGLVLAPLSGQRAEQAVLASQDPRGTLHRIRAKGEQGKKSRQWTHSSGV